MGDDTGEDGDGGGDEDGPVEELAERLHDELRATEEYPVERSASRRVGEAQAVAGGVAGGGVDEAVIRERVGHVLDLLSNVETTGNDAADAHVETAREVAGEIVDGDNSEIER